MVVVAQFRPGFPHDLPTLHVGTKMARRTGAFVHRLLALLLVAVAMGSAARAQDAFTDPALDAALVMEARTGHVLYARNADALRHPASLTKMMALYLLFEQMRLHKFTPQSILEASAHAAHQPRVRLGLRIGTSLTVDLAIRAIVVCSANDVAVALAESLGGSEERFSALMTARARALGMTHTTFVNATGLPDEAQLTTAADMAILARRLIYDFPEYFAYFRETQLNWRDEECETHNSLLGNFAGADGLKTGYTEGSGFNLAATAERNGTRLVAIVMGGLTAARRDEQAAVLLNASFNSPDVHIAPLAARPLRALLTTSTQRLPRPRHEKTFNTLTVLALAPQQFAIVASLWIVAAAIAAG